MSFWMGVLAGLAVGFVVCSVFYMWMLKVALSRKDDNEDEFLVVQRENGKHLKEIAEQFSDFNEGRGK